MAALWREDAMMGQWLFGQFDGQLWTLVPEAVVLAAVHGNVISDIVGGERRHFHDVILFDIR